MFKKLDHITDLKYSVSAKSLDGLFEEITYAISDAIYNKQLTNFKERYEITLKAKSLEILIHDYIDELIYVANYEYKVFTSSEIHISFDKKKEEYNLLAYLGIKPSKKTDYSAEIKACSFSIKLEKNKKEEYETIFLLDI